MAPGFVDWATYFLMGDAIYTQLSYPPETKLCDLSQILSPHWTCFFLSSEVFG